MVDQLSAFASEVTRVALEVGTQGILGGQAKVEGVQGTWADLTRNVNVCHTLSHIFPRTHKRRPAAENGVEFDGSGALYIGGDQGRRARLGRDLGCFPGFGTRQVAAQGVPWRERGEQQTLLNDCLTHDKTL